MRVPLGVIGIIYESRPNVTIDAAAPAIKSGNAAILRGGSEAIESNRLLAGLVARGTGRSRAAAPTPCNSSTRPTAPRSGCSPHAGVRRHRRAARRQGTDRAADARSRVPMIKHLDGICHVYIDGDADLDKAVRDRRQRQDAALRHVQHDGDAAGAQARRGERAAAARPDLPRQGGRAALLPGVAARSSKRPGIACVKDATSEDWPPNTSRRSSSIRCRRRRRRGDRATSTRTAAGTRTRS